MGKLSRLPCIKPVAISWRVLHVYTEYRYPPGTGGRFLPNVDRCPPRSEHGTKPCHECRFGAFAVQSCRLAGCDQASLGCCPPDLPGAGCLNLETPNELFELSDWFW